MTDDFKTEALKHNIKEIKKNATLDFLSDISLIIMHNELTPEELDELARRLRKARDEAYIMAADEYKNATERERKEILTAYLFEKRTAAIEHELALYMLNHHEKEEQLIIKYVDKEVNEMK